MRTPGSIDRELLQIYTQQARTYTYVCTEHPYLLVEEKRGFTEFLLVVSRPMGATGSRSSPTDKTTHLVRISQYSKLVRLPVLQEERTLTTISFGGILWNVIVKPRQFNEGLTDCILVSVFLDSLLRYVPDLDLKDTHISLEILDETGENTVFLEETDATLGAQQRCLMMALCRRELEASSCVHNDTFTVRCTLSRPQATEWRLFSEPKKLAVLEPQVAMARVPRAHHRQLLQACAPRRGVRLLHPLRSSGVRMVLSILPRWDIWPRPRQH
jgi:hypothetical protein